MMKLITCARVAVAFKVFQEVASNDLGVQQFELGKLPTLKKMLQHSMRCPPIVRAIAEDIVRVWISSDSIDRSACVKSAVCSRGRDLCIDDIAQLQFAIFLQIVVCVAALKNSSPRTPVTVFEALWVMALDVPRHTTMEELILLTEVEATLSKDPCCIYKNMTLQSRIQYHQAASDISRNAGLNLREVAEQALVLACNAPCESRHESHVGYYLIDNGLELLSPGLSKSRRRVDSLMACTSCVLAVGVAVLMAAFTTFSFPSSEAQTIGMVSALTFVMRGLYECILLFRLRMGLGRRRVYPMLSLADDQLGASVLIAIPMQLTTVEAISVSSDRLQRLAEEFLGKNTPIVLLIDLCDADAQLPSSEEIKLIGLMSGCVEKLRALGLDVRALYRDRKYVASDAKWRGWERKRGKLVQLNRLLLGNECEWRSLYATEDPTLLCMSANYVIVLDEDGFISHKSAGALLAQACHPLSIPKTRKTQRGAILDRGHAIITPRVLVEGSQDSSFFKKCFFGDSNSEAASTGSNDVWFWTTGVAMYGGKGIYHVKSAHDLLDSVFPENFILSHDIVEGLICGAAHCPTALVYEDCPSSYAQYLAREERWTRGDFQNLFYWTFHKKNTRRGSPWLDWVSYEIVVSRALSDARPAVISISLLGAFFSLNFDLFYGVIAGLALAISTPPVINALFAAWDKLRMGAVKQCVVILCGEVKSILVYTFLTISLATHHALMLAMSGLHIFGRIVRGQGLLEWKSTALLSSSKTPARTAVVLWVAICVGLSLFLLYHPQVSIAHAVVLFSFAALVPGVLLRVNQ